LKYRNNLSYAKRLIWNELNFLLFRDIHFQ